MGVLDRVMWSIELGDTRIAPPPVEPPVPVFPLDYLAQVRARAAEARGYRAQALELDRERVATRRRIARMKLIQDELVL